MEKGSKNKQQTPQPQGWDKTNRNFQRTANEEDVRGEMNTRSNRSNENKPNKKVDKHKM